MRRGRKGNQENLIEVTAQKSHDIVRNRLLLTSLVNLLTFLTLIFAMSYYDWGRIEMPFYVLNQEQSDLVVKGYLSLYINLLYGKQMNVPYYQTYPHLAKAVCLANDIFCQSIFQELECIGVVCTVVMAVGAAIQIYGIVSMVRQFCGEEEGESDDNLRHYVSIGHYLVGITLNIFGLFFMEVQVFLGVSFWIFVGGVGLFIGVVIAQQIALNNLNKQKLILTLLKGEKKASNNFDRATIELSEDSERGYI